jgi:uncharacterized protein involved in exopolysaccharide biosynthesis
MSKLNEMLKEYESLVNARLTLLEQENKALKKEVENLKARNEKLSKRKPTTEEAVEQYWFVKNRSKRKENDNGNV